MLTLRTDTLASFTGYRGSGKTTLAIACARVIDDPGRPCLVFDPWDEWGSFIDTRCYSASQLADFVLSGTNRVRLTSANPSDAEAIFILGREFDNALLIVDEADFILRSQWNPESFQWIVSYGRHFGQALFVVARRAAELPRSITAQGPIFFPNLQEPRDKKYFRDRTGYDPETLAEYEFIGHSLDGTLARVDPRWIWEKAACSIQLLPSAQMRDLGSVPISDATLSTPEPDSVPDSSLAISA